MGLFKPDWERTIKILTAIGETMATGNPPKGLNDADLKLVKTASAALEAVVRGAVHVVNRARRS